jgi:sugar lactone lactonase YvrE
MKRSLAVVFALLLVALASLPAAAARPTILTGRLLVPGADQLGGAWGMAFDDDDNLWIGNISARTVTKVDGDSGLILARYGPDAGAEGADDVAFNPVDGDIYYTAILTGEVGRIGPDGSHSTVTNLGFGVNPITFSDDGRLFVGKGFVADGLWEVDPATGDATVIVAPTGDPANSFNGFDWYAGYLWAPHPAAGLVVRIDPDAAGGDVTPVVTGLTFPKAVDVAPDGTMYVLVDDPGRVYRFDPDTGQTWLVAHVPLSDNMAIDSRGRLFVSGGNDGGVYRVLPNGKVVTISPPGLSQPYGLAAVTGADGREVVYVADKFLLYAFNGRTGQKLLQTGAVPIPDTVAADGENLILTSGFANAVWVWNPAGGYPLAEFYDFNLPLNAIRFDGDLVVAELLTGHVVRMNEAAPAVRTTLAELAVPTGMAASGDDLYVVDWALGMLFQLVKDGEWDVQPLVEGLAGPEGLAMLPDGDLLVVETWTQRLSLIDVHASPVTVTPLLDGLDVGMPAAPGMPPTWTFDGVAVGPSGTIYLSSEGLYRYQLIR